MSDCHDPGARAVARVATLDGPDLRVALIGSPNAGKTTLFNALTGGRAKTANYPGVTVTQRRGRTVIDGQSVEVIDLPGTYSLSPVSPDEQVVVDALEGRADASQVPDAIVLVADATSIERSLLLVAEALVLGRPTCLVLTMIDELTARGGAIDVDRLAAALGVPVVSVVGHRRIGVERVRELLTDVDAWPGPVVPVARDDATRAAWIRSIVAEAVTLPARRHRATDRIDRVVLHPVWGSLLFAAVMLVFFQVVFTVAAPAQDAIGTMFEHLAGWVRDTIPGRIGELLGDGAVAGVGTVVQFLPQIMLLFAMISTLENVGYMSRAAFVVDRLMARFGLEGRCFVSMLSSFACAVPGIMSTRSIPSSRDRIATILAAPLMTCSARLPVFTLLIGAFVPDRSVLGPIRLQGLVLLGLYLLGAIGGLAFAAVLKATALRDTTTPFYMELPPYRWPTARLVLTQIRDSAGFFLRKAGTTILATSMVLWILLHVPFTDPPTGIEGSAADAYRMEHSLAGSVGRAIEPVFAPLGFDWRIDVAVIGSFSARETFVATLAQTAAADEDHAADAVVSMARTDGDDLFDAGTVAAVLVFFVFALQCMSTIAVIARETNSWRWPAVAFGSMSVAAYAFAFIAHEIAGIWT